MANTRSLELYMNAKGGKLMTRMTVLGGDDLPDSDAEIAKAIELAVKAINSFPREFETQLVVVEDGLIVAIEGLTTRELVWCN